MSWFRFKQHTVCKRMYVQVCLHGNMTYVLKEGGTGIQQAVEMKSFERSSWSETVG